jgi:phage terminase large subunit-like protein
MRGPQYDGAWSDELAAWNHMREAWDMLQFGLRLETRTGRAPRQCVTTTPRPKPLIRELVKDPATVVSKANTYANAANLSDAFLETLRAKYEGTRLGRQEIDAEILEDTPGALWTRAMLDEARGAMPERFDRVVIGVDPSGSDGESGDSQGIAAVGKIGNRACIIEDASTRQSPEGWARVVSDLYDKHGADAVIVEKNYGGDMCRAVLQSHNRNLPVRMVTATRGKHVRAEPVAALYEQGRVTHASVMTELEDQLCLFTGNGYAGEGSPDRADAAIWALTELMLSAKGEPMLWRL